MDFYTQSGRTYVNSGDIFELETSVPLELLDVPDFVESGNRSSTNGLYNLDTKAGSYYVDFYKKPSILELEENEERENLGINSIWSIDWNRTDRIHDTYFWTGINISGEGKVNAFVTATGIDFFGISSGELSGNYELMGQSLPFYYTGETLILIDKKIASDSNYRRFCNEFVGNSRGLVRMERLFNLGNPSIYGSIDANTETGRHFLSGEYLDQFKVGNDSANRFSSGLFFNQVDSMDNPDKQAIMIRASTEYIQQTASASIIASQFQEEKIKVYDIYFTEETTEESNPVKSVTSFTYPVSNISNGSGSHFQQAFYFDEDLVSGQLVPLSNPSEPFLEDSLNYTFIGSGEVSGLKTGELGEVDNISYLTAYIDSGRYAFQIEQNLKGILNTNISGFFRARDLVEENFYKISGDNISGNPITGQGILIPENEILDFKIPFKNFEILDSSNIDNFRFNSLNRGRFDNYVHLLAEEHGNDVTPEYRLLASYIDASVNIPKSIPIGFGNITDPDFIFGSIASFEVYNQFDLRSGSFHTYRENLNTRFTGSLFTQGDQNTFRNFFSDSTPDDFFFYSRYGFTPPSVNEQSPTVNIAQFFSTSRYPGGTILGPGLFGAPYEQAIVNRTNVAPLSKSNLAQAIIDLDNSGFLNNKTILTIYNYQEDLDVINSLESTSAQSILDSYNITPIFYYSEGGSEDPNRVIEYDNLINSSFSQEAPLVSGVSSSLGQWTRVTGQITGLNSILDTGISKEYDLFDYNFLNRDPEYIFNFQGSYDLTNESFYTYIQSTGIGPFTSQINSNTPIFPLDFPEEIYFQNSFGPYFSNSIDANIVFSGSKIAEFLDITTSPQNIELSSTRFSGSGFIDVTGEFAGLTNYSGIFYYDQDVISPAYDFNYNRIGAKDAVLTGVSGANLSGNIGPSPDDPNFNEDLEILEVIEFDQSEKIFVSSDSLEVFFDDADIFREPYVPQNAKFVEQVDLRMIPDTGQYIGFGLDDDFTIFLNDVPIVNPRRNILWYDRNTYVWSYTGAIYQQDKLEIAIFDGFAGALELPFWEMDLIWSDGFMQTITGGYTGQFNSSGVPSAAELGISSSQYYSPTGGGPWAESYVYYTGGQGIIPIQREDDFTVEDVLWVEYNTSEIKNKIAKALGVNFRLSESVPSYESPEFSNSTSVSPVATWEDVGFICGLDELKNLDDAIDEKEEDERRCGTSLPCGPGGAGGAGGGDDSSDGGGSSLISGTLYSGTIFLNDVSEGDFFDVSPYNFDYISLYQSGYQTGFPNINILDQQFFYSQNPDGVNTFSNAVELANLFNRHYKTFEFNKSGLWQWYKLDIEEYNNETTGDFYYGPLLEAIPFNSNTIGIKSLVYGDLGAYKIEATRTQPVTGISGSRYQYDLPRSIALQGSDNGNRWKTIMKKDFFSDGTGHEILQSHKVEREIYVAEDLFSVRIEDEVNGRDAFIIETENNVISSGSEIVTEITSTKTKTSNLGIGAFTGIDFPRTGINIDDFFESQIQLEYEGATGDIGLLLGYISGYQFVNPNSPNKATEEGLLETEFFRDCPKPIIVEETISTIVSSGVDEFGNLVTRSFDEVIQCTGCEEHILLAVPRGHSINSGLSPEDPDFIVSGWVEVDCEAGEEDLLSPNFAPKREEVGLFYSGFFTGTSGLGYFDTGNLYFDGNIKYAESPQPIFSSETSSGSIGIYEISSQLVSFGDFSFETLSKETSSGNFSPNEIVSYRTGFILENEIDYNYYRFLTSGYDSVALEEDSIQKSGIVVFDEVNLYGPTEYILNVSGSKNITLYDATYSGDLEVFATGLVTGTQTGTSESGILQVNAKKTGTLASDIFYEGQQIFPTEPFYAEYKDVITGIGLARKVVTGLFYDNITNTLYNEVVFEQVVTGNTLVSGEVNRVTDIANLLGSTDELIYVDETADARFTGLGDVLLFQSGVPSFVTATGLATGFINSGSGSYIFDLSDTGNFENVFRIQPTGFGNSIGTLNYNNPILNDGVSINGQTFLFRSSTSLPNFYKDITGLRDIINSGDYNYSAEILDQSTIQINSLLSGESGNSISTTSIGSTGAPFFNSNSLTGGQNIYQSLNGYGLFTGRETRAVNNTGNYDVDYKGSLSGLINLFVGERYFSDVWNLFSGKYNKDINFKSGEAGNLQDITSYSGEFNSFGTFPGQFSVYVDYTATDFGNRQEDVAKLTITSRNLTGYEVNFSGGNINV